MPRDKRRVLLDPETGILYHAWEAPHELECGGISSQFRSIVFESAFREWVGSMLVYRDERLMDFTDAHLRRMLQWAIQRGREPD